MTHYWSSADKENCPLCQTYPGSVHAVRQPGENFGIAVFRSEKPMKERNREDSDGNKRS